MKIIFNSITGIIGLVLGLVIGSSNGKHKYWENGFDDGVAYAVEKYVDGKLLKVPDEPMPANFVDCWFVNVLTPQAFVSLRSEGGTFMHGNVISVGGVLSSRTVNANVHERFEQLNREQRK